MHLSYFKKILYLMDSIENNNIMDFELQENISYHLSQEGIIISNIDDYLLLIRDLNLYKITHNGFDLSSLGSIFAKSGMFSLSEYLCFFEIIVNLNINLIDDITFAIDISKLDTISNNNLTSLIISMDGITKHNNSLYFDNKYSEYYSSIINHYQKQSSLSTCLLLIYIKENLNNKVERIEYRNTNKKMINYDDSAFIMSIIKKKGIPVDRDITKPLQSFFKDNLINEYEKACPICKANIIPMLIASHIKPFRDCAHIYETVDQNNGILLCKNHDYLFDQGLISFSEDGFILIHKSILKTENFELIYNIPRDFKLDNKYLSRERRLFLQFHRNNIFKK